MLKVMPPLSFNQKNLGFMRLMTRLQPGAKIPASVRIERAHIPSQDGQHQIRLRIYKPQAAAAAPAPGLLWIHGGGYIIGRPEMDDAFLVRYLQELGLVIVSVDYRLAPEHPFPAPLDDCYSVLVRASAQARTLGLDPTRIAVGGESAGGGLGSLPGPARPRPGRSAARFPASHLSHARRPHRPAALSRRQGAEDLVAGEQPLRVAILPASRDPARPTCRPMPPPPAATTCTACRPPGWAWARWTYSMKRPWRTLSNYKAAACRASWWLCRGPSTASTLSAGAHRWWKTSAGPKSQP